MTRALSWTLDLAAISGDGVGKPRGVLASPELITVDKEQGQQNATITYANILDMFVRLHLTAMQGAMWLSSSTAIFLRRHKASIAKPVNIRTRLLGSGTTVPSREKVALNGP
jgi:HK97 family phage major capsid protein